MLLTSILVAYTINLEKVCKKDFALSMPVSIHRNMAKEKLCSKKMEKVAPKKEPKKPLRDLRKDRTI